MRPAIELSHSRIREPQHAHLKRADIALLLLSSEFFNSHPSGDELQYAMQQRSRGMCLVPVLLRAMDLEGTALAALHLRALPHNGRPIVEWRHRDRAFTDIVKGVREVADAIQRRESPPSETAASGPQTRVYVLSDKADRVMRNRFVRHLKPYEAQGRIRIWHADQLTPGDSMETASRELARANVVIPLISADFLAAAANMERLQAAVTRQQHFEAVVVPIQVRPVAELPALLHGISCFPTDGQAISLWDEPDEAWSLVVREIMGRIQPAGQIPTDPRELPSWSARARLAELRTQLEKELPEDERNVPGPSALLAAAKLMQTKAPYVSKVELALHRIRNAADFSARQLAVDVFFLRMVAAAEPVIQLPQSVFPASSVFFPSSRTIDLPTLLPGLFVELLTQQIRLSASGLGIIARGSAGAVSKAAVEPEMLRITAQVIGTLAAETAVDFSTQLTLTFQLAQWYFNSLDSHDQEKELPPILASLRAIAPAPLPPREAAKDLFYPFRFAADRFNYRLAAILYSLGPVEPSSAPAANPSDAIPALFDASSAALENLLVKLAALPLSEDDRELLRQPLVSCLGWDATEPSSVPELALCCLLARDMKRFADLPEPARSAWLERLAPTPENTLPADKRIFPWLLLAGGEIADKLSETERQSWAECAAAWIFPSRTAADSDDTTELRGIADFCAWSALVHLYGAGETHLLLPLQRLFSERLKESIGSELLGYYFEAVSRREPHELKAEVMRILELAKSHEVEAHEVAGSLARAINSASPRGKARVQAVLRAAAEDERYASVPLRNIARRLGVSVSIA